MIAASPAAAPGLVALAEGLKTEDALQQRWCYARKSRSTTAELWNAARFSRTRIAECAAAWRRYLASPESAAALDELLEALRTTISDLREMRTTDTIGFDDPTMPEEIRELS
jgi:hypothetical protein